MRITGSDNIVRKESQKIDANHFYDLHQFHQYGFKRKDPIPRLLNANYSKYCITNSRQLQQASILTSERGSQDGYFI